MEVVNPATGDRIDEYETATWEDLDQTLDRATAAFEDWKEVPLREREELLVELGDVLRDNKERYATLMTREMGKPITQSRAEVEKCVWACEHYAKHADEYLEPDYHPSPPGTTVKTVYEPLGTVLAVMPWNYPFWQVIRFAVPYTTAGNVGVLKHSSDVPGCSLALEEAFREAGFPEGVFQSTLAPSDLIDDALADERLRAATLTGSGPAGRAVASAAGEHLKKTVMELGGSDPFVVLDDADLDDAIETGGWARHQNGGQSCIAGKRFVVHTDVYDEFVDGFVDEVESYKVGDPMDEDTDVGAQASRPLMEELHEQVEDSVEAGATLLTGGEPLDRDGAFYPPTVLTDLPADCPAASEETFGPVAAVFEVDSEQEAIELANDTRFGLGASIWTEDRDRGERVARQIDAGLTYVNELVKSDPRVPFGGIKDSGYGRELAEAGMHEFLNRKTVWVN